MAEGKQKLKGTYSGPLNRYGSGEKNVVKHYYAGSNKSKGK